MILAKDTYLEKTKPVIDYYNALGLLKVIDASRSKDEIYNQIKLLIEGDSYYKLIFTVIMMSFGGLSILMQIKSILKDANLDYSLYYKSRIIHLVLFMLIILILA